MNMFVFEDVAARRLSPEEAAERLVQSRQAEPAQRGWLRRLGFAIVVALLGAFVPSLAWLTDRRS